MPETEERDIADLANEQLKVLTQIEELVDDLVNDREVYDYQIEEANENLPTAQSNAAEIARRYNASEAGRDLNDQPRKIRVGHLTQTRALMADNRVRVAKQKRKHTFGAGTSDRGPEVPLFTGTVDEARAVHAALEELLYGDWPGEPGGESA